MEPLEPTSNYDPLAFIDHASVCEDLYLSIKGDTSSYIHTNYELHDQMQRPVFRAFEYVARRMRELDEDDVVIDDTTQIGVFKSGVTLALGTLEHMAIMLGIDVDDFYQGWEKSSVLVLPPEFSDDEKTEVQKIKATTEVVEKLSSIYLESLPQDFAQFVQKAEKNYMQIQGRTDMFRTAFGYVLGSGYRNLQYMYERRKFGDFDLEALVAQSTEEVVPTHQFLADKFVRLIKSGNGSEETSLESIFGNVMQDNVDSHEAVLEVLHTLTIALHGKEGEMVMDDTAAAFFTGANLGAHIAIDIGEAQLGKSAFIERWTKARLHRELSKYGPDYYEHTRTNAKKAFERLRERSQVPDEYVQLISLIQEEMDYDDEDGLAFRDGFQYALVSLLNHVESQKKGDARRASNQEIKKFDEEFASFIHENDLTGGLQEVFQAYLDNCRSFDLDPNDLTEDEASTILELTLDNYDKLMPELSHIEVHGPCFLQVINAQGDDPTLVLLKPGEKLTSEISGFRIALGPADESYAYVDPGTTEIGEFPLRYMPSYVLKNCYLTLEGGTVSDEEMRIIVGFAVPGTKFRRTDL